MERRMSAFIPQLRRHRWKKPSDIELIVKPNILQMFANRRMIVWLMFLILGHDPKRISGSQVCSQLQFIFISLDYWWSGVLPIPWSEVLNTFDGLYLSWDPSMYPTQLIFHGYLLDSFRKMSRIWPLSRMWKLIEGGDESRMSSLCYSTELLLNQPRNHASTGRISMQLIWRRWSVGIAYQTYCWYKENLRLHFSAYTDGGSSSPWFRLAT